MSKQPEMVGDPSAKILPYIWLFIIISVAIASYFFLSSGTLTKKIIEPLKIKFSSTVSSLEKSTVPPIKPVLTLVPSKIPTPTIVKKVVAPCFRINIREGEFASNKCYSKTDYDNLNYYLHRLDSANFNLQTAQGTINITCNCRVAQECEFFKDSCSQAQQKKSQAETDISKYRSMIQFIIAKGK